jgi:hypothetical protein
MKNCRSVSISMKSEMINSLMSAIDEADQATIKWYQQLIESLMWSAVHIRFDLAFSVRILNRYAHNLNSTHCALVKQMLRYVADSINVDLTFERSDNHDSKDQQSKNSDLIDYSDSDFVELKDKKHSIEDYVFMLIDETTIHSSKQ